jgi:hypothetical protein
MGEWGTRGRGDGGTGGRGDAGTLADYQLLVVSAKRSLRQRGASRSRWRCLPEAQRPVRRAYHSRSRSVCLRRSVSKRREEKGQLSTFNFQLSTFNFSLKTPSRIENIVRIELGFNCLHEGNSVTSIAPNINFLFDFDRCLEQ